MVSLKKNNVLSFFLKLKKLSVKMLQKGNVEEALKNISTAARLAYMFNFVYKDDELEQLLSDIASDALPKSLPLKKVQEKKYVFLDAFGHPNRGLTQQYLRGLISMNVDFLYISEYVSAAKKEIYDEVEASVKGKLCLVPDGTYIEKIRFVYSAITDSQSSVLLAHITPWDVVATTVLYALPDIIRYNINLTDHAFWLGTGCFNYTLEFRKYGCAVSVKERGFMPEQVLLNPYYPIIDDISFLGFPEKSKNKTIIFSGGNYYKIYGEDQIFLKMMKRILDENPDAVILFAGTGNDRKPLEKFIAKHRLEERLLLIGSRRDINQVFAHCDVYLNTYPFGGGLMAQYAAYNAKPVVAYSKDNCVVNDIEDLIFSKSSYVVKLTYRNLEDYYMEICRLVKNQSYRISQGKQLKNALNTKEEFDSSLSDYLNEKKHLAFNILEVDIENNFDWYMEVNKTTLADLVVELFIRYNIFSYIYFPLILLKYTPSLLAFFCLHFLKNIKCFLKL